VRGGVRLDHAAVAVAVGDDEDDVVKAFVVVVVINNDMVPTNVIQ
jgi:hypothetical protein